MCPYICPNPIKHRGMVENGAILITGWLDGVDTVFDGVDIYQREKATGKLSTLAHVASDGLHYCMSILQIRTGRTLS